MAEDFPDLNNEEKLRAENDFLKMKLMLEQGATFTGMDPTRELPAAVENIFLRNMVEFEKQYESRKTIKVFDKIKRPSRFKPVSEIPDHEIEKAWQDLSDYLLEFGITITVCSPRVSGRELYRFATEEFFDYDMEDINITGMMYGFIYDEFHPDYEYENTQTATLHCINHILRKDPLDWMHHYSRRHLGLNQHFPLSREEFRNLINRFKLAYESFETATITDTSCVIDEENCQVLGRYRVKAFTGREVVTLDGDWKVYFHFEKESSYWDITEVHMEGISF